ncbi:MAG: hypothetical protein AAF253_03865 [Pseudomonadota bacterium]
MAALFDAYIMVDWSAAAKPVTGLNSIWIGILAKDARLKLQFRAVNPDTRLKARTFLEDMVDKLTRRGDRVLLGFDFSFGYPAGTADALGLDTAAVPPWKAIHDHLSAKVREKPDNSNARFAIAAGMNYAISKGPFPFWGAPSRDQVNTLAGKKPTFTDDAPVPEYRLVERVLRESGRGQPKSAWQLAYTGSVGSQMLLGIPHVAGLRDSLPSARIWPFETGLSEQTEETLEGVQVVIAEIYPSLIDATPAPGQVLDAVQVEAIARHYADLDRKNRLGPAFAARGNEVSTQIVMIEREEGWILGT